MSPPKNQAAWIEDAKVHPFIVKDAPYPTPQPDEVVVDTRAVAMNPIDMKVQSWDILPLKYPNILGCDLAGEIVEVGSAVKNFKKGDRVLAYPLAFLTTRKENAGYQKYVACSSSATALIPTSMSYEQAAVLPACFSTAGMAFFTDDFLGLNEPKLDAVPSGKTVFVWGGSSAVGSNAIQLGKAAGYDVAVTTSPKNFEYCKSLGADYVFDYNQPGAVDEIVAVLKDKRIVGALDTVSEETLKKSIEIVERTAGKGKVASVHPFTEKMSTSDVTVRGLMAAAFVKSEVGSSIWRDFLPKALEVGKIVPKPDPVLVGKGLESIQEGVDRLKQPISAQKLVVAL